MSWVYQPSQLLKLSAHVPVLAEWMRDDCNRSCNEMDMKWNNSINIDTSQSNVRHNTIEFNSICSSRLTVRPLGRASAAGPGGFLGKGADPLYATKRNLFTASHASLQGKQNKYICETLCQRVLQHLQRFQPEINNVAMPVAQAQQKQITWP